MGMTAALESDFYDEVAEAPTADHALRPMWDEIARRVGNDAIVDLGCGAGGLIRALGAAGYNGAYIGVDFSSKCIELALASSNAAGIDGLLLQDDLRNTSPLAESVQEGNTTYVLTEVLEHLDDDLGALARWVEPGRRVLFSVPNHASKAHVRHFKTPAAAFARYGHALRFTGWQLFPLDPPRGRAVHLFDAIYREDALC